MPKPRIESFPTREALYDAVASTIVQALNTAVAVHGVAGFAATGGSPRPPNVRAVLPLRARLH